MPEARQAAPETPMPRFLAIYAMRAENIARFRALPKSEQDAIDQKGLIAWNAWSAANVAAIIDQGGMVGKTKRISKSGIADAVNDICGYLVVEAATLDAAARLFENHPHVTIFPGDAIDVMPLVTD